jgi:hypothetical protein
MNALQALAVAAAALAISGDPLGGYLARAEAHLARITAHAELYVGDILARASETEVVAEAPCSESEDADEDWAKGKHGLPDTSIHLAVRAARL